MSELSENLKDLGFSLVQAGLSGMDGDSVREVGDKVCSAVDSVSDFLNDTETGRSFAEKISRTKLGGIFDAVKNEPGKVLECLDVLGEKVADAADTAQASESVSFSDALEDELGSSLFGAVSDTAQYLAEDGEKPAYMEIHAEQPLEIPVEKGSANDEMNIMF